MNIPETGRIFALGLNKTGTTTLGHALNMLGIPTIDYPTDSRTLEQLEQGDYKLDILKVYKAVTDMPVGLFYPQLDRLYPGSRFILTVRDKSSWLKSVGNHWPFVMEWGRHEEAFRRFTYYAFTAVYGSPHYNEDRYSYVYDTHEEGIRRYFSGRPDDILIIDISAGEGWEKLCPFLGIPIPEEPFPHLNRMEEKAERHRWIDRLEEAIPLLNQAVASGSTLILIDEDKLANSAIHKNHCVLPFREKNGEYNGPPADSIEAIVEMERLRSAGATHIALPWSSFWWLDHYSVFFDHLRNIGEIVLDDHNWLVFRI